MSRPRRAPAARPSPPWWWALPPRSRGPTSAGPWPLPGRGRWGRRDRPRNRPGATPPRARRVASSWLASARSHVAERDRLPERGEGIARGHELVGDVAGEAGVGDGRADRPPLQLLRLVELVAPGHAAGVVVADELVVRLRGRPRVATDGADDVALHDLHVIDVEQHLHLRRADRLHDLEAVGRPVAQVVLVVDLAVEDLEGHRHSRRLRDRLDPVEADDAVVEPLLIGHAFAVEIG